MINARPPGRSTRAKPRRTTGTSWANTCSRLWDDQTASTDLEGTTDMSTMLAATIMRPLGSMLNVRMWKLCGSAFCVNVGSPVFGSIEDTAMLFSPPRNTRLPSKSTVALARFDT